MNVKEVGKVESGWNMSICRESIGTVGREWSCELSLVANDFFYSIARFCWFTPLSVVRYSPFRLFAFIRRSKRELRSCARTEHRAEFACIETAPILFNGVAGADQRLVNKHKFMLNGGVQLRRALWWLSVRFVRQIRKEWKKTGAMGRAAISVDKTGQLSKLNCFPQQTNKTIERNVEPCVVSIKNLRSASWNS